MSGGDDADSDKPYEASRRKLEDARKKGEIVRSQDVVSLGLFASLLVGLAIVTKSLLWPVFTDLRALYFEGVWEEHGEGFDGLFTTIVSSLLPLLAAIFVLPVVAIIAGLIAGRQIIFTPSKLAPKLSKVSPLANAKKKFGPSGLFEFAKSTLKFLCYCLLAYLFYDTFSGFFGQTILFESYGVLQRMYHVTATWFWSILGILAVFAAIDVMWQVHAHAKKNRMSHKELKDEHKNEEGDESMRQQRRARAEEIATNRMLLDVPKAAVVITNPTHYAIALKWDGGTEEVPKLVAKGADETARKIRELAIQSGVPIYSDPPTARLLYATVGIGSFINRDHYKAAAIAIGYARRIQGMQKR
ncbi:EscU/YscU/HrcU family type III secretion system export apparatus switch protein [Marivita hallyeonensis]|uniref:Flagellar biosynthetic protein FlhB n=1 Tax=Marivita hallyeonensis TaxID=996342 RepID=A0A1M5UMU1_9RHOB|nr:flagellar type III secretion system protein FlhB [Marivita hallyeonensis]SHH64267.1 flagellar biosynthetic protein FlhB [Marivita hallyeonensis]